MMVDIGGHIISSSITFGMARQNGRITTSIRRSAMIDDR